MNVGVSTLVEFLHKKGFADITEDLNQKLTDEQYNLLVAEYSQDKAIREGALLLLKERMGFNATSENFKQEPTTADNKKKYNNTYISEEPAIKFKTVGRIDLGKVKTLEDKIDVLVDDIYSLIKSINKTYYIKENKYVFEPSDSDIDYYKCTKLICQSEKEFGEFLSTIYLTYYERSKSNGSDREGNKKQIPGQRIYEIEKKNNCLPNEGFRKRLFFKIIEPLRAFYVAHLPEKIGRNEGSYTVGEALEQIKGNRNTPETNEFPYMQYKILTIFKEELNIIKGEVYNLK